MVRAKSFRYAAPTLVQFELRCLQKWRYQAGKPLGPISSEAVISKGLLNYADPSSSAIKGFTPNQLHELLKRAVVHKKGFSFTALRQMSVYVLQICGSRESEIRTFGAWDRLFRSCHFSF